MQLTAMCYDSLPVMIEIGFETRRKNIKRSFNFFKYVFLLKASLFSIAGKENFFLSCFFYFSWTTLLKFTLITFLRSRMKTRKNMTGAHASGTFRKWAQCQKRFEANKCKKMQKKTRKNITGPHTSVYLENGHNAKNAHENEKMHIRTTCLCVFRKWAKCQKRS